MPTQESDMNAVHNQWNVQYGPASRTALLQCGNRSKVLRDLPCWESADAMNNWGYVEGHGGGPARAYPLGIA